MFKGTSILILALALGSSGLAPANDVYYDIVVRDLKLVEGRLPERTEISTGGITSGCKPCSHTQLSMARAKFT